MGAPRVLRSAVAHLEKGDWKTAHEIVQKDEDSALSCWAHGIVHVMEGDLPNAKYWYRQAKRDFPEPYSVPDEIAALKNACD
jgi:hypothetical protein